MNTTALTSKRELDDVNIAAPQFMSRSEVEYWIELREAFDEFLEMTTAHTIQFMKRFFIGLAQYLGNFTNKTLSACDPFLVASQTSLQKRTVSGRQHKAEMNMLFWLHDTYRCIVRCQQLISTFYLSVDESALPGLGEWASTLVAELLECWLSTPKTVAVLDVCEEVVCQVTLYQCESHINKLTGMFG